MLSIPHMIVVFVVVLVVFGPNKLPELARGFGKLMAEFRKASTDFRSAFEEEMRDLERQAREVERKKTALAASAAAQAGSQPATLATPSGAETQAGADSLATVDGEVRATEGDVRAGSGLVATPAADAVPRSVESLETMQSVATSGADASPPAASAATVADVPRSLGPNTLAEPGPNAPSSNATTITEHSITPVASEELSSSPNDHHRQA